MNQASNYRVWYAVRDASLVDRFLQWHNKDSKWLSLVIFSGGAGTGKTYVLAHLSTRPNVCFMCPTNVSGGVMVNTLSTLNLFGRKTFKADLTIFKHYRETVQDADAYNQLLYANMSFNLLEGNCRSLDDFYEQISPVFEQICLKKWTNAVRKFQYITVAEYTQWGREKDPRWTGSTVDYILAAGLTVASRIPAPLRYDTYVIDEAGREPCMTGLFMAYYYRWVLKKYNVYRERPFKLIAVGSATQNKVINRRGHKIDDYSLITIVDAPFFRHESFCSQMNVFNRRVTNKGNVNAASALTTLIERVELGLPVAEELKKNFLKHFLVPSFFPDKESIRQRGVTTLHIAKTHKTLREFINKVESELPGDYVRECLYTLHLESVDSVPPVVYTPHEILGASYQSVTYKTSEWTRTKDTIRHYGQDQICWVYHNERRLFLNTMYKLTHPAFAQLLDVDGTIEDFLEDYSMFHQPILSGTEVMRTLVLEMILHLGRSKWLVKEADAELYQKIDALTHTLSIIECDHDEDDNLENILLELIMYLRKMSEVVDPVVNLPLKMMATALAPCVLPQGCVVITEAIRDQYILVRLGKTLHFKMYKKTVTMEKMSITEFPTSLKTKMVQQRRPQRRKPIQSVDDWMDELIHDEMEKDVSDTVMICPEIDRSSSSGQTPIPPSHVGVAFSFFPIKLRLVETIDSTQSETYNFDHLVEITKDMPAEDFIVATTRLTNVNFLTVSCSNPDEFSIKPLLDITKNAVSKFHRNQIGLGWI